jgi:predicted phosphoribosyltransferase
LDQRLVAALNVSQTYLQAETTRQRAEIQRRMSVYRGDRSALDFKDKTVILTDDGVATGATMRAAIQALRATDLDELIVALPVGPPDTIQELSTVVDRMICLHTPTFFWAVGGFYTDFRQTSDAEVIELLQRG